MNRQASLLRGVFFLGLAVSLSLVGALFFLSVYGGVPFFPFAKAGKSTFAQALEEYDLKVRETPGLSFRDRNSLLDALEKKAQDVESTLSVLKRRRHLALRAASDREQYAASYFSAAIRAQKQYPHSTQIAALAAETMVLSGPLYEQDAAELKRLALLISSNYQDLSLAFAVYSGAMADPVKALSLPREMFPLLCSLATGEEREKYLVNVCLRTLLEDNEREAVAMVNSLFETVPLLDQTILFGAEFFYDHGNFLRAAELFSAFTTEDALARQGDCLWLAGFEDSARGLWRVAVSQERPSDQGFEQQAFGQIQGSSVKARAFYNLASTALETEDAQRWLEQLFSVEDEFEQGKNFAIIKYSRLSPLDRALIILQETDHVKEGLFDLEMLRRRSEAWTMDRTVAETWFMLNRHPNDDRLYEWAIWYFDFQRCYEESNMALRDAKLNQIEGPWMALHQAYAYIREQKFTEAEKVLKSIVKSDKAPGRRQQPLWQASATLAMLLERQRKFEEALQYFELAANQLGPMLKSGEEIVSTEGAYQKDAARIQVRIARLLRSMGKRQESFRVLDYALDLDPDSMEARMEKRRLSLDEE